MPLPLVVINGWAMPDGALDAVLAHLPSTPHQVIQLSALVTTGAITLESLVLALHHKLSAKPCQLIGWSYGGMLACAYAARFPQQVKRLTTLAMNPCFVAQQDWPAGMADATFNQFVQRFSERPEKTLKQFMSLCCMGSPHAKRHRQQLLTMMPLDNDRLLPLLQLFGATDIRPLLATVQCPTTHVYSEQDAVVPVAVTALMQRHYPQHRTERVEGSHCFFMDHPECLLYLTGLDTIGNIGNKEVAHSC